MQRMIYIARNVVARAGRLSDIERSISRSHSEVIQSVGRRHLSHARDRPISVYLWDSADLPQLITPPLL